MNAYYLLLGYAQKLALTEVDQLLHRRGEPPARFHPHLTQVHTHLTATQLVEILGGTIKVYTPLDATDNVAESIAAEAARGVLDLAFSTFQSKEALKPLAFQVKQALVQAGRKLSFRLLPEPSASAGILSKHQEYLLPQTAGLPPALKCVAVQNITRWSLKDFGRPQANPHRGMLPPKVARMLVNCGLTQNPGPTVKVYDPMCGQGTILMEALDLGCSVFGSDHDPQAVAAAQTNLDWFAAQTHPPGQYQLFLHNVQNPTSRVSTGSLDLIVFEGYLGPAQIPPAKINDYIRGLTKLYLGAFKLFHTYLKTGGRLVAAIPAYVTPEKHVKSLDGLIDRCEKLGYTAIHSDLAYFRPQALVRRQILIWQKT